MTALPHIERSESEGRTVLHLVGEFDLSTVDLLRTTFLKVITAEQNEIIVDLSETTFLDSMALGSLIGARRRAAGWGGYVHLAGPTPSIRKVLAITKLDSVFNVVDTAALGSPRSEPS